jgi:hypothetical protein
MEYRNGEVLALRNEAGKRGVGGMRRRGLLLTMREAPKIVRADCDLCQAADVCMPPEMWRCGSVREKLEESLYTVLTVDARRGSGSDRIVAKTTERRRTISTFIRKEIVSPQQTKWKRVVVQSKARPCQCQWKMRRTRSMRRYPGDSLI